MCVSAPCAVSGLESLQVILQLLVVIRDLLRELLEVAADPHKVRFQQLEAVRMVVDGLVDILKEDVVLGPLCVHLLHFLDQLDVGRLGGRPNISDDLATR